MNIDKKNLNLKQSFLNGLPMMIALIGAITFFFAIYRFDALLAFINKIIHMLMPIIIGIVIAYLINPIVVSIEKGLIQLWEKTNKKSPKEKSMRMPAIGLTFVLLLAVFYLLASMVVPQLQDNIAKIIRIVPGQVTHYYFYLLNVLSDNQMLSDLANKAYHSVMDFILSWVQRDMFDQMSLVLNRLRGVVGAVSNSIIGVIVAIYLLISKETFKRQFDMIFSTFLSDKVNRKVHEILDKSNSIFGGFISGKIVDSLIIGAICFIGALVLRLPYPALVSVIVGVTNIIPFFGPYIGAIPSAILIFLDSPTKCIIFIIFVVVLQQVDGNIIGPKILGESTGLSPFWVIFSILLFSGLFGIVGMIVGVPAFGVLYYLAKTYLHYRMREKEKAKS